MASQIRIQQTFTFNDFKTAKYTTEAPFTNMV